MYSVIPLLLLVSNALALLVTEKPYYDLAQAEEYFQDFVHKYGKIYESQEEANTRFEIFKEHLVNINKLNENDDAIYDINEFSDISYEEFKVNRLGLKLTNETSDETEKVKVDKQWIEDAPDSLDYRDQGLVTPVRNQGLCGSCYVFAGVASIEGQYAKKHKELLVLSVQQGLDCDTVDNGCAGGHNLVNVINEIGKQGGSELEEDYPYEEKNDKCRTDTSKIKVKVTNGIEIDTPNEEELKGAVAKYGPLSVVINADGLEPDYHGGVISPTDCDPEGLNHGVLVVGYGTENKEGGKPYWIVKNSWGATWGDKGFFFLERGKGYCGFGSKFTACANVE